MKKPLRIAVTGGAGQIAYQLLFRIGNGDLLGAAQPVSLSILEKPDMLLALEGVKMELQDCAFPLLHAIDITADPAVAFRDAEIVLLIGSKPRGPGMERKELLEENGKIFIEQGRALNASAAAHAKVFVIGNPCNTNCLIALHHAPRLKKQNFFAMTRLDQNRASFLLANKAGVPIQEVSCVSIWGNHSSTQVADFLHAKIKGMPAELVIGNRHWLENDFFALVQQRGATIIQARGKSSAASAAQAVLDAVQDTLKRGPTDPWFSSAIYTTGNPYGIEDDLIFSFPCYLGDHDVVTATPGLVMNEFMAAKLKKTERELIEERDLIRHYLKG